METFRPNSPLKEPAGVRDTGTYRCAESSERSCEQN